MMMVNTKENKVKQIGSCFLEVPQYKTVRDTHSFKSVEFEALHASRLLMKNKRIVMCNCNTLCKDMKLKKGCCYLKKQEVNHFSVHF